MIILIRLKILAYLEVFYNMKEYKKDSFDKRYKHLEEIFNDLIKARMVDRKSADYILNKIRENRIRRMN